MAILSKQILIAVHGNIREDLKKYVLTVSGTDLVNEIASYVKKNFEDFVVYSSSELINLLTAKAIFHKTKIRTKIETGLDNNKRLFSDSQLNVEKLNNILFIDKSHKGLKTENKNEDLLETFFRVKKTFKNILAREVDKNIVCVVCRYVGECLINCINVYNKYEFDEDLYIYKIKYKRKKLHKRNYRIQIVNSSLIKSTNIMKKTFYKLKKEKKIIRKFSLFNCCYVQYPYTHSDEEEFVGIERTEKCIEDTNTDTTENTNENFINEYYYSTFENDDEIMKNTFLNLDSSKSESYPQNSTDGYEDINVEAKWSNRSSISEKKKKMKKIKFIEKEKLEEGEDNKSVYKSKYKKNNEINSLNDNAKYILNENILQKIERRVLKNGIDEAGVQKTEQHTQNSLDGSKSENESESETKKKRKKKSEEGEESEEEEEGEQGSEHEQMQFTEIEKESEMEKESEIEDKEEEDEEDEEEVEEEVDLEKEAKIEEEVEHENAEIVFQEDAYEEQDTKPLKEETYEYTNKKIQKEENEYEHENENEHEFGKNGNEYPQERGQEERNLEKEIEDEDIKKEEETIENEEETIENEEETIENEEENIENEEENIENEEEEEVDTEKEEVNVENEENVEKEVEEESIEKEEEGGDTEKEEHTEKEEKGDIFSLTKRKFLF